MGAKGSVSQREAVLWLHEEPTISTTKDARGHRSSCDSPAQRSPRTIERLFRILGEFTLILDDGRVRHFWNHDPRRSRRLSRAIHHRHVRELVDDETFRWIESVRAQARRSSRPFHSTRQVILADGAHEFVLTLMSVAPHTLSGRTTYLMACDLTKWRTGRTELQKSQTLLAQAEELANVGSWELDLRTNTLIWSAHFFEMLGLPRQAGPVPDGYGSRLIHPDDRERAERDADQARRTGQPFENDLRFVTPHRGVRIFHSRAVPVRDALGRVVRIRGMSQDVTEQREAEQQLREREALLTQAEQIANLGSYRYDGVAKKGTLSPNLRRLYGIPEDAGWSAADYIQCIHPEDRPQAEAAFRRAMAESKPFDMRVRFLPPGGGDMRVHIVRGIPILDCPGDPGRRVGIVQDVTEQHHAEESLREREALLSHAEEIANLGSYCFDFATGNATLSPNLRRIFGLATESIWNSEACWRCVHPEDRSRVRETMEKGAKSREPFQFLMRYTPPGGEMRWLQVRAAPQPDSTGRTVALVGVVQDITEQRTADEKRRAQETLLAQAEHIAVLGSWQYDFSTGKATYSPNLARILGVPSGSELDHSSYWDRIHPDDRARARQVTDLAMADGKPFEYEVRFLPPEGGVRILHIRGMAALDSAGKPLRRMGVVQDVTQPREAETKSREREALLSCAEEIASFGSYEYDCVAKRSTLSPNLRKLYGIEPDVKWTAHDYWERLFAPDRRQAQAITDQATKQRKPFEYVARFRRPSGETRVHLVRGVPVYDENGAPLKRIGVIQDVTEQVRQESELRRLSQDLLRARDEEQRRIARELHESAGQTLAALKMSLGRLRDMLPEGDSPERAVLRSSAELADEAVREVRTVSYLMHPPMLDEAGLVPALRWFTRGFADRSGIRVSVDIPGDLPRSSREMETTVFRIVQEALTNVHRYSGSRTAEVHVFRNNGDLIAEIRDQGCGLPPPTRLAGAPTDRGVGIAGMRERVKQLNGTFELESTAGKGTIVRAILPVESKPSRDPHVIHAHLVSSVAQKEAT